MSVVSSALSTTLAGIEFASPLMNASGAFNPSLFSELFSFKETLGAIVTKTVTPQPRVGNAQHRTAELPGIGMLNSIGLQNPGLQYFLEVEAPQLKAHGVPLFLSVSGNTTAEFAAMAAAVREHPNGQHVDALEMNLSCPNVEKGGIEFCSQTSMVKEAVAAVVEAFDRPVFAKLTPNIGDIVPIGAAALEGGAVGLTAINTVLGAAIDIRTRRPILKRVSGGYSGPGIKPVAIHHIFRLHRQFPEVPILGVGGAATAEDVLEFLMAGASVVQVGTSCFRDPLVFSKIVAALQRYCEAEGISRLSELVGCAHGS